MTERGIIFSAPMVRALLAGAKTQTRRIVKPQPTTEPFPREQWGRDSQYQLATLPASCYPFHAPSPEHSVYALRCPYGAAGDRLYVKETVRWNGERGIYAADDAPSVIDVWPWQRPVLSCLHLPRGAARITLAITEVRVQRVQEISEEDAKAEGVTPTPLDLEGDCWSDGTHVTAYQFAWNEIHGWNPNAWAVNPWVWALTFRVLDDAERGVEAGR